MADTISNMKFLEDALHHKDDHHLAKKSGVQQELLRINERLVGNRSQVDGILKSYHPEEIKNNQQELDNL